MEYMKDALCCLFVCYLTIIMMIKSAELMEKKGLGRRKKKDNKVTTIITNVIKIITNHLI